ncbi:MAG: DUF4118 domain-containing protein [Clostridiales bacterium]|nr:DUF4118 domain-containing protein [Clostridiales bacterium]
MKLIYRICITMGIFIAASGIGYIFRSIGFPDTNIVVVYLLAVLMTAWLARSFAFGFVASLLATFLYNYFFAEPIFTFSVNDPNYIVTIIIMTITALITSTLTSHVQRSATEAREKEAETKAIFDLTKHLTDADGMQDIAGIAVSAISAYFSCNAACLCYDEENQPDNTFIQQMPGGLQVHREVADPSGMKHRIDNLQSAADVGAEFHDWPIYGRESVLGLIRMPNDQATSMDEAQKRLLRSMIESIALAMDRFRSTELRTKTRDEVEKERYRANLLRAVSHDIRTPLSGMIGTTEMLLGMTDAEDPRNALLVSLQKSAGWLHSLVDNILNLTRLQNEDMSVNKQHEAVEEVIGGAISHMAARAPEYEITVDVPEELLLAPMDAKLIEQVMINLLDNAVKHTKPDKEIRISAGLNDKGDMVCFSVKDRGTGFRSIDLPNVFKMFYTSHNSPADAKQGIGIGLAICETIVKAHGGGIEARNREDGPGAEIEFTLPLEAQSDAKTR